jgi:putative photosynthetic complex assembly protein 2
MSGAGWALAYALFVWWFSTGAILYLDGLPRRTYRWSLLGATAVAWAALVGLATSSDDVTPAGAYCAFTCAVLVWGWQEMAFLMGIVTGPRKTASPPGCTGWRHFVNATQTLLYHELALLAALAAVIAVTWGSANQVGAWTFLTLWVMRLSAKLNLFLGVRNTNEQFLPAHLSYLKSFLTRRPLNLLFPVSITASTAVAALMVRDLLAPGAGAFEVAGLTLVASLLVLAILEHWFLVLPVSLDALWRWGFRSHAERLAARP